MATVKTPEERGPLGAWAYDSRDRLGLSVEQVAVALPRPVNPATIRKAEADSKDMSKPLWRALTTFYREVAKERNVALDALPAVAPEPPVQTTTADLMRVISSQAAAIDRLVERIDLLLGRDVLASETVTQLDDIHEFVERARISGGEEGARRAMEQLQSPTGLVELAQSQPRRPRGSGARSA